MRMPSQLHLLHETVLTFLSSGLNHGTFLHIAHEEVSITAKFLPSLTSRLTDFHRI